MDHSLKIVLKSALHHLIFTHSPSEYFIKRWHNKYPECAVYFHKKNRHMTAERFYESLNYGLNRSI